MSMEEMKHIPILVVDDHFVTRDMVQSILRSLGFTQVYQAENGLVALDRLEEFPIELIICDWNMPNMTGLELLKEVRRKPSCQNLPFLMLTAEAYRENVSAAVSAGVSDYVAKPFTADTLGKKVMSMAKQIA